MAAVAPPPAEVMGKAMVQEARPAIAATPQDILARAINKRVQDEGFRPALTELAQRTRSNIDEKRIRTKQEDVLTGRNASGEKVSNSPEEDAQSAAIEREGKLMKKYVEHGLDSVSGLTNDEIEILGKRIIAEAAKKPYLREEIGRLASGSREEGKFMRRILADAKFEKYAQEVFEQVLGKGALANIAEKEDKLAEEQGKRDDLKRQLDAHGRWEKMNDDKLREFEVRSVSGVDTPGEKLKRLNSLPGEISTAESQLVSENSALDAAKLEEAEAQNNLEDARGTPDEDDMNQALRDARRKMRLAQEKANRQAANVARLRSEQERLGTEQESLIKRKQELEEQKRGADMNFKKAELMVKRATEQLNDAKSLRTREAEDLVKAFEDVAAEAASKLFADQAQERLNGYDAEIAEKKKHAESQLEEVFADALTARYRGRLETRRVGGVFGWGAREEQYRPINEATLNADWGRLMSGGGLGADNVMRDILGATRNPETGANYTTAEIDGILADKSEGGLYAKWRTEMVAQLTKYRGETVGWGKEEVDIMVDTPWGRGMIEEAMKRNQKVVDQMMEIEKAGDLSPARPEFWARFRHQLKSRPGWLALLLVGAPFAWAIGAAGQGLKEDLQTARGR